LAAKRFLQLRAVPSGREFATVSTPGGVQCAILNDDEFLQDSGNKVKLKMARVEVREHVSRAGRG
jgi:hypothetical protein